MSKVITFSKYFPSNHPKAGEPTYFVEKIYNSLYGKNNLMDYPTGLEIDETIMDIKKHTIRSGHRWKAGDKFSPRVWSGKPYHSKQIIIGPDIEIEKVWDFSIQKGCFVMPEASSSTTIELIAKNDGLNLQDFKDWFQYPKDFDGQIICWDETLNY